MSVSEHLRIEPVAVLGAGAGLIVGVWIGLGVFVQALLVVMVADVITGLIAAGVEGKVSSHASRRGLAKKSMQMILVLLVAWLTANMSAYLGEGFPGADALAGAFVLTELVSILENAKRVGVNLGPLERVLAIARQSTPPDPPERVPHG